MKRGNFRNFMKIEAYDDEGRKFYRKEGEPKEVLKDCILHMRFQSQILTLGDMLNFNFAGARMVDGSPRKTLLEEIDQELHGKKNRS